MADVLSMMRRLGGGALDLLYPPRCGGCGRSGAFVCEACIDSLSAAEPPRCSRCWRPGSNEGLCFDCQLAPPAYDGLRAAFVYQGVARELVHALKFRAITALAEPMSQLLAQAARRHSLPADIVVPVPLSGLRRRLRGHNQAEALARPLARELGLPLAPGALRRRRHTAPQARSADRESRRRNVAGAFAARERHVAGRRVLLVDDVTTTGATLAACASALRKAGTRSVWALAFARED